MQPSENPAPDTRILEALLRRAGGSGVVRFDAFMETALYEPEAGYYASERERIGRSPDTDFFTASSSPLFGRLVAAAAEALLPRGEAPAHAFVELGAERGRGVLDGVPHPFGSYRKVGIGQALSLEGPCVVFSNELLDAQPVRRFRRIEGRWRELGVRIEGRVLTEAVMDAPGDIPPFLPEDAPDTYTIDAPLAASDLTRRVASQPWTGLFLAFDYGKSWAELSRDTPQGTARAYHRHTQSNDLLARPGQQDLTCHICWDWIAEALQANGFTSHGILSQEAFFVRHAAPLLESLTRQLAPGVSAEKRALAQLLHPAHMGQRFQALSALRLHAPR